MGSQGQDRGRGVEDWSFIPAHQTQVCETQDQGTRVLGSRVLGTRWVGVTTNVASERPFHGFVLNAGSQMSVTNHFAGEFSGRIGWPQVDRDPSVDLEPGRN